MERKITLVLQLLLLSCCLLLTGFSRSYAQQTVSGIVTDTTGMALPGVSVSVKGLANIGTSTDLNGRYILDVPSSAVLVITLIGFQEQEIQVNGQEVVNVTMQLSSSQMDEVVVVVFGSQKRQEVVGAVTTVRPGELREIGRAWGGERVGQ